MPTSTVGLGKTYATLQAWADATAASALTETAECYSGSDLGGLFYTRNPLIRPTAIIYAASGHRHNGTDAGTTGVAYSSGELYFQTPEVEVRGLRVHGGIVIDGGFEPSDGSAIISALIEKNLVIGDSAWPTISAGIALAAYDAGGNDSDIRGIVRNNIILNRTSNLAGVYFLTFSSSTSIAISVELYNNTVSDSGSLNYCYLLEEQSVSDLSLVARNNIGLGADFDFYSIGSATIVGSHNLSSDATGDDWGATGSVINATPSDVIVNVITNPTLKAASPARDVGTDLSATGFADDAIYVARPQGIAWDMGALELVAGAIGRFRRRFTQKFWRL